MPFYKDNFAHLVDELRKLDLLIQRQVLRLRLKSSAIAEEIVSPKAYISHGEVDWLLHEDRNFKIESREIGQINNQITKLQNEINTKLKISLEQGIFLALPQLAHLFALSPFELQVVIICLAPELQRKYDKLFVYLQDDITRKKPSVDLVLDLLCESESERWQARAIFSEHSPLFHFKIIHKTDDPQSPSGSSDLACFLKLDPRILNYLLGNNGIDGQLINIIELYGHSSSIAQVVIDPAIKTKLIHFTQQHFSKKPGEGKKLAFYFHGPYGVGKRDLALMMCENLKCPLLYINLELLLYHESDLETLLRLAFREGLLLQTALFIERIDILLKEDEKATALLKKLVAMIAEYGWLTFLSGEKLWSPRGIFENIIFYPVQLIIPDVPMREQVWNKTLEGLGVISENGWCGQLARQFRLTPGQIRDVVEFTKNHLVANEGQTQVTLADLYTACRYQSNQKLTELAIKIEPKYSWEDIILPDEKLIQLKEICNQVKLRYRVFSEWGFNQKLSHGKGLSVLFSGPPGTGKTMAAEVIAHELQLDLYKVDLSGVVSKYIGETEKNLAKIFYEAETSNAILFFDEADALFGKRTEVSDAHDRYANIETSYLLQKMEEYEGIVILASNLRENMDDAFTRRIRFIVEFPFPDEKSRLGIWKTHFPKQAPVSDAIDYEFLSKQFQIAGGNIKNIVLNAAFLAAENGGIIGMEHILHGTRREFEKIGKLWDGKNSYKIVGKI